MTTPTITAGTSDVPGATYDGHGVHFAVFSENATSIELCLFDRETDERESARLTLPGRTGQIHHGYVAGLAPGQLYAYRARGPYRPEAGLRFNPEKILIDPYARGLVRCRDWYESLAGADPARPNRPDGRDSAGVAPLSVVLEEAEPQPDDRPRIPLAKTILYETHVKSISARHPDLPPEWRGSFRGLGSEPIVRHLVELGVTSVELLPVFQHFPEPALARRGLPNYWGYNTLSFFAPDIRYAGPQAGPQQAWNEFRAMLRSLHAAGLEVILDVVFNHSAEGDEHGPTVSFRGLDNPSYYRLDPDDPARYQNDTGCGNALRISHPHVLKLVIDSLRLWARAGVDGFRFDLGTCLARDGAGIFRPDAAFFGALWSDPLLADRKLIVEPWDLGAEGYRPGDFPEFFQEWNDRFRDGVRRFWIGKAGPAELATRLAGSSDLFEKPGRTIYQGVNFITAHDGFSLRDLVSYDRKHNEANGEKNRDGHDRNHSWNCGVEGETGDPSVLALRARQKRNLMATLLLARGLPMLSGGDELGQTRGGNNNAYCQDNAANHYEWTADPSDPGFLVFVRRLIELRKRLPLFGRGDFLSDAAPEREVHWYEPTGIRMTPERWQAMTGFAMIGTGQREAGQPVGPTDTLLVLFHPDPEDRIFVLPPKGTRSPAGWSLQFDTARDDVAPGAQSFRPGDEYPVRGRSLVVLTGPFGAEER